MKADIRQYGESLDAAYRAGERNARDLATNFINLLSKRGDKKKLQDVLRYLEKKEFQKKGTVEASIETAFPVSKETEKKLLEEAQNMTPEKKMTATFVQNPDLQSGFRIRCEGRELDQSFTTHLKKLRKKLISH